LNHFIEVDEDPNTSIKYLIIHSGSRNFGLKVASYYQDLAHHLITADEADQVMTAPNGAQYIKKKKSTQSKKQKTFANIKPYSAEVKARAKGISSAMSFLMNEHANGYIKHMKLAQIFASLNRRVMAHHILQHLGVKLNKCVIIESVHNYIDFKDNIIRKGAISARKDELVVIPLNMADGTIIGKGCGNPDWNYSAPHGAGRRFSRTDAKKNIHMDVFRDSMKHVWSECVNKNTLDEAPQAYKDASYIKNRIAPTVEIIAHLKPVFNFKAGVESAV
jgi:tRNA-splicing ligase RtcB